MSVGNLAVDESGWSIFWDAAEFSPIHDDAEIEQAVTAVGGEPSGD
jgi:hypothetical protein